MKLLVDLAKNPEAKERLVSKRAAESKLKFLVQKHKLVQMVNKKADAKNGGEASKSRAGDLLRQVVATKTAEGRMEKAMEDKRKVSLQMVDEEITAANDEVDQYEMEDRVQKEENEDETGENDDVANVHVGKKKQENDQLTDQHDDIYSVVSKTQDVRF